MTIVALSKDMPKSVNPTYLQLDTTTDNGYTAAGVLD